MSAAKSPENAIATIWKVLMVAESRSRTPNAPEFAAEAGERSARTRGVTRRARRNGGSPPGPAYALFGETSTGDSPPDHLRGAGAMGTEIKSPGRRRS